MSLALDCGRVAAKLASSKARFHLFQPSICSRMLCKSVHFCSQSKTAYMLRKAATQVVSHSNQRSHMRGS